MVSSRAVMATVLFFLFSLLILFSITLPFIFIPPSCPKLRLVESETTILLNFTGKNVKIEGYIGTEYYNPNYNLDVFYNTVSVSFFYNNVNDNNNPTAAATTTAATKFLVSTNLPTLYMSGNDWISERDPINGAGIVNNSNTIGLRRADVKFSVRLSSPISFHGSRLFRHHRKGCLINLFCYPLTSHVLISSSNSTTVSLSGFSC